MQRLRAPCATCLFGSGRCRCCGGCRSYWCSSLGFLVLGLLGCALCFACFALGLHFIMLGLFGLGLVFGVLLFRGFRCLCGSGCCRGGRCCGCCSRCLGKSAKRGDNQSSSDQRLFQHIQFPCMANLPWVLNPRGLRAVYRRCVNLCKAASTVPRSDTFKLSTLPPTPEVLYARRMGFGWIRCRFGHRCCSCQKAAVNNGQPSITRVRVRGCADITLRNGEWAKPLCSRAAEAASGNPNASPPDF